MLTKHVLQTCRALSAYQFGTWFAPIGVVVSLDARALQEVFFGSTQGSARGPNEKYLNSSYWLNKWPSKQFYVTFCLQPFWLPLLPQCTCFLWCGNRLGSRLATKKNQKRPMKASTKSQPTVIWGGFSLRFWTHVWDLVEAPPFLSHVWNWLIHIQNTISKQPVIICYTETTSWNKLLSIHIHPTTHVVNKTNDEWIVNK